MTAADGSRVGILREHRWLTFVLPFAVYMVVGSLEPQPGGGGPTWLGIDYSHYPLVYTAKLAVTLVAIWYVWPGYREFAFRLTGWSVSVGVIGVVVWVGLCALEVERAFLPAVGLGWVVEAGVRVGFNPFEQLADRPALAYGFFVIRLLGLAAVVPLIEEFLLRGFIVRFFSDDPQWWEIPFGSWNRAGIVAMTVLGAFTHPAELLAALVWISLVTWLMLKTRNIWDCVAAHAVTNLLLGIYVLGTGQWQLL